MSSGVSGTSFVEGLPPEQLSFAKFKDIAIPDGAVMDMENTKFLAVMTNGLEDLQLIQD